MNIRTGMAPHRSSPANPGQQEQRARRDWRDRVPTGIARPSVMGAAAAAIFFAVFGSWAAWAPIDGAVVAVGVVQASGQNQLVEHLEGGIVASIAVLEGQSVKVGDPLLTLDTVRLTADRDRVRVALIGAEAQLARAEAERDGKAELAFPTVLNEEAREASVETDLDQQRAEFINRMQRHAAEVSAVAERVTAVEEEIEGLSIQKTSEERKLAVLRDELTDKSRLLEEGLTQKSEYNALLRAEADALGAIGSFTATIGQRRSAIAELAQQRLGIEAKRREAAAAEVNELRSETGDLRQQLRSREDMLGRSEIRSPTDGIVVKILKNTVGSVIKAGEAVVEIVPTSSELIIDARIAPRDVDAVKVGQAASLRLTALNARTTPQVDATVAYLSADRFIDQNTREPYYTARLRIAEELPTDILPQQIQPGMPVDIFIKTGVRTFIEYLAKPIQDSFAKAFREE